MADVQKVNDMDQTKVDVPEELDINLDKLQISKNRQISENEARLITKKLENYEDYTGWIKDFLKTGAHKCMALPLLKTISENLILSPKFNEMWPEIFNYFSTTLNEQLVELRNDKSGSPNHEAVSIVHKIARTILGIYKSCWSLHFESADKNGITPHSEELVRVLIELFLENLPLETCVNLALVLCYCFEKNRDFYFEAFGSPNPSNEVNLPELHSKMRNILINSPKLRIIFANGILGTHSFDSELYFVIGKNILEIDLGSDETKILAAARCIENMMIYTDRQPQISSNLQELLPSIEIFTFIHIMSNIGAVRNASRTTLEHLASIYNKTNPFKFSSLLIKILDRPEHVKWISLSCIAKKCPDSLLLLDLDPSLPQSLLAGNKMLISSITDTYYYLMNHHFEEKKPGFNETWIKPLFQGELDEVDEGVWDKQRDIIKRHLRNNTPIARILLTSIDLKNVNLIVVETIKIANSLGFNLNENEVDIGANEDTSFKGIIPWSTLEFWMLHSNPQVRLAAFSLIAESKKTSQLFTTKEIDFLKLFFKYNIVSQNPGFRQEFYAKYKRLMIRIRDGMNLLKRKREDYAYYEDFLQWLWNFLTEGCLFPSANFARRFLAGRCLEELLSKFNTFQTSKSSLDWFTDTYEANKRVFLAVLSSIPPGFTSWEAEALTERAFESLVNVHPPESVTGKYLIQFLINADHIPMEVVLERVYKIIEDTLNSIQTSSLLTVATKGQIYGCIGLLRMIFSSKMKTLPKPEYIERVFRLCFTLNHLLFPILASPSPEGFLIDPENERIVRSLNSQMLLVFCWRTMKDICLFFTDTCFHFEIQTEGDTPLVTLDQIERIGSHLLYLLQNLMHRGVFEQVFIGFKTLAQRLWKSKSKELNSLPEKWLERINEQELSGKCITRRSSGLPFIYLALLPPGNEEIWINKLLEDKPELSLRIHSMNILRGFFRDANYAPFMFSFVPQGIQLAFKALKSSAWTERNAGLMFFGAIIRRSFGPKLNLMSAHMFFKKYPNLYSFLVGELTDLQINSPSEYTYYVLLLLSCFASSAGDRQGVFELATFVPLIRSCGSSPDVQVRKMSGKALLPFLNTPQERMDFIQENILLLKARRSSNNAIHGLLIQCNAVLDELKLETELSELKSQISTSDFIFQIKIPLIYEELAKFSAKLGFFQEIERNYADLFTDSVRSSSILPGLANCDAIFSKCKLTLISRPFPSDFVAATIQDSPITLVEQLLSTLINEESPPTQLYLDMTIRRFLNEEFALFERAEFQEILLQFIHYCLSNLNLGQIFTQGSDKEIYPKLQTHLLGLISSESGGIEGKKWGLGILVILLLRVPQKGNNGGLMLSSNNSPAYAKEVINLMLSFSEPIKEDDIRIELARALPPLPFTIGGISAIDQAKLWLTILKLAQDDIEEIRLEILHKMTPTNTFCELKSFEILLDLFYNGFVVHFPNEGAIVMTSLLVQDKTISICGNEDDEEERLFDRSELNSFKEISFLAKLFMEVFPPNCFANVHVSKPVLLQFFADELEPEQRNKGDLSIFEIIAWNLDDGLAKELISTLFGVVSFRSNLYCSYSL